MCDRQRRMQPAPFVGKACMHASHYAYQDAARFTCQAQDWMKDLVGDAPSHLHARYNSNGTCAGVTVPTNPPPQGSALDRILSGCREGYRDTYKATLEMLVRHLLYEFPVLKELKLQDIVYQDEGTVGGSGGDGAHLHQQQQQASPKEEEEEEEEIDAMQLVVGEQLPPDPLFLRAIMPDGSYAHVPVMEGLETEHSVVTYCHFTMPHVGSACARHIMKHLDKHKTEPATLEELSHQQHPWKEIMRV